MGSGGVLQLSRFQTASREINQIQDQLAAAVNPFLRLLAQGARVSQFYTSLPSPSSELRGLLVGVQTPGQPCTVWICLPNSAGGYEWVGIASST